MQSFHIFRPRKSNFFKNNSRRKAWLLQLIEVLLLIDENQSTEHTSIDWNFLRPKILISSGCNQDKSSWPYHIMAEFPSQYFLHKAHHIIISHLGCLRWCGFVQKDDSMSKVKVLELINFLTLKQPIFKLVFIDMRVYLIVYRKLSFLFRQKLDMLMPLRKTCLLTAIKEEKSFQHLWQIYRLLQVFSTQGKGLLLKLFRHQQQMVPTQVIFTEEQSMRRRQFAYKFAFLKWWHEWIDRDCSCLVVAARQFLFLCQARYIGDFNSQSLILY